MPCIEPYSQTSIRHSTRVPKPSARKRAHSESISRPLHSSQRAKKPSIATPRLVPSRSAPGQWRQTTTTIIDEVDTGRDTSQNTSQDADEDAGQDAGGDMSQDTRGDIEEDEEVGEDEDIASITDNRPEEEEEEEEEEEANTMSYLSVWKAIVNNKEVLCSKSRLFTVDLTFYSIQHWQREVLENAAPRQLEVIKLEAIASYERCRTLDECPFELQNHRDIYDALEILRRWNQQRKRVSLRVILHLKEAIVIPQLQPNSSTRTPMGRRTATQRQITELPDILQSESTAGNSMPQVADHWACLNGQCRNKGKTCWVNKPRPGVRDNAAEHYPVPGEIFRRWSREIADNLSTVEQPSQQIILLLANWREREHKKSAHAQLPRPAEDTTSTTNQLLQILIAAQVQHLPQNLYSNRSNSPATPPPCPLPYTPPVPSSPIRSSSDPNEVLTQFFDWLTAKSNASQAELLESVKNKLLDEDWSLDALRDERRGGAMTSTIWESYGFKLGTLAKIRSRISEFKQQQRPQSRDSAAGNNSS
ncbi:MAG: hypothetical protein M1840_007308 [Geoglossum simile]|nr:MAG: hypothetical protein M1840_007308 [Geoglossum simile]